MKKEEHKITPTEISLLGLIADIRNAVGDPNGRLMQDELIIHCRRINEFPERLKKVAQARIDFIKDNSNRLTETEITIIKELDNLVKMVDTVNNETRDSAQFCKE